MRVFIFIFLYGMLTLTGLFLSVYWTRMTYCRFEKLSPGEYRHDKYFLLTMAFSFVSFGSLVLFGSRAWSNFYYGLSKILHGIEGMFIGIGLVTILAGMIVMVWLADLEKEKPRWLWGMILVGGVWAILAWYLSYEFPRFGA